MSGVKVMTDSNPVVRFCPKCGHPVEPGTKFCMNCGEKLPALNTPVQENTVKPVEVKKEEPKKPVQDTVQVSETCVPGTVQENNAKPAEVKKPVEQTVNETVQDSKQNTAEPEEKKEESKKTVQESTVKPAEAKKPAEETVNETAQPSAPHVTVNVSNKGTSSPQNNVNPTQQNANQQTNNTNTQPSQVTVNVPYNQPYLNQYQIPLEYQPISAWGYVGYNILLNLPVVGLIVAIVLNFETNNKNLKNLALSYIILQIIRVVLTLIIVAILGASLVSFFDSLNL